MKKFWNLMLAALVVLGAVACTESVEDLGLAPQQGLSFEATIDLEETRTDVVFNEESGKWNTVWTGNETLTVVKGWSVYEFKNSVDNKNRFVCANDGAKDLVGQNVTIKLTHDADYNTLNSKAGKAGGHIEATVESFDPTQTINLEAKNAFLRYSSTSEVTLDASAYIFDYNGQVRNTITLPAGEDVWVAVKAVGEVTLSYSIDGEKCKEKVINIAAKKIYNLGELELPKPEYKIYVYKYNTNWSDVYMYMWDDVETYIFGIWPGSKTTVTEVINGYEYMVWTIPTEHNGKTVSMILNNNNGSQTADFNLGVINEDKYVILNSGMVDFIEDANNPEPEIPAETHKIYVYKYNNTWTKLNLYSWDSVSQANYTGGWPGSVTTVTEVINGYTYYVWEMPAAATGRGVRIILNNGSAQTADSDVYTLDKDVYVRLNGTSIQDIDDINNPEPTVVAQPRKVYATTTLSWSKMNIYAWGGGTSFGWPGAQMSTETINGTKYYVYTFDSSFDGATLSGVIFNNGSAQTVDITNVKLDQDRFFRVLTSQSGGKYKYEAIADPR